MAISSQRCDEAKVLSAPRWVAHFVGAHCKTAVMIAGAGVDSGVDAQQVSPHCDH